MKVYTNTYIDSLARLTGEDQEAVNTTAFTLQLNPKNPGIMLHKLDGVRDKNFWSVRVNSDIRLIVHKTEARLFLCYVGHHDDAYRWAKRHKSKIDPETGDVEIVEVTVKEIVIRKYVEPEQPPLKPPLFANVSDDDLLIYGVPPEWLDVVHAANEDTLMELVEHLPSEVAEALLDIATGDTPQITPPDRDPVGTERTKEEELLTFLMGKVFGPILGSPKASGKLKAGVKWTIARLKKLNAKEMIQFYWSSIAGNEESTTFARWMKEEGFPRFEEHIDEFRDKFNDRWLGTNYGSGDSN